VTGRIARAGLGAVLVALGAVSSAVRAQAVESLAPPNVPMPVPVRVTFANGMKLILVPRHELPLLAVEAVLRGGARVQEPSQAGVAALTAELLSRGAGARDAYAFADALENSGGSLGAGADLESLRVSGQFLAGDESLMLNLLSDMLLHPRFEPAEFEKLKQRRIEGLRAAKDSEPQALLGDYAHALLFEGHPFAVPVGGSEATLATLKPADVTRYYREQFGPERTTLVIAGDFEPARLRAAVEKAFGSWPRLGRPLPPLAAPVRRHGRRVLLIDAPGSTQTYFWLGNVGVARNYPARAALNITDTAFGGGPLNSMLSTELREKRGLTYSISSYFVRGSVPGEFAISSFVRTEDTARAIQTTLDTLATLHQQGLDAKQINAARNYILGQYPLAYQSAGDWAEAFADLDFFGFPISRISGYGSDLLKVQPQDIEHVIADAFPAAGDLDLVLIGDAQRIREAVAKFGPVREKPLSAPDYDLPAKP
jgi:predicted Zn-dependent peptidase